MKFTPADNYEGLLIQARALHQLATSKEKQLAVYCAAAEKYDKKRLDDLERKLESEKT